MSEPHFRWGTPDDTEELQALQDELWGWHDMRRKSARQIDSPCRVNRKGRCDRPDCCLRWPEDPRRFR
jgi:hypothetical protein